MQFVIGSILLICRLENMASLEITIQNHVCIVTH